MGQSAEAVAIYFGGRLYYRGKFPKLPPVDSVAILVRVERLPPEYPRDWELMTTESEWVKVTS
jgi:hypothetical protein